MTNIEKYNQAFVDVFAVNTLVLNDDFSKNSVGEWDSIHQLNIISLLEDSFDVMFDPEDIMEFVSYGKGRELLKKYDIEL